MNPIIAPFVGIYNLIQWSIEHLANWLAGNPAANAVGAFGLAILIVTIVIRLILLPLFRWQYQTQLNMAADNTILGPRLKELRKKHKGDPQALNREMMKMYKDLGMSPYANLAGCLPLLIQIPFLFAMYDAIRSASAHIRVHPGFLWIPDLSKSALTACCHGVQGGIIGMIPAIVIHIDLFLLPVVTGILSFMQFRMIGQTNIPGATDQQQQMGASMGKSMGAISGIMLFVFALEFSQGLVLYYLTITVFSVIQQYVIMGWGNLTVPSWFPGTKRTAELIARREKRIEERIRSKGTGGAAKAASKS